MKKGRYVFYGILFLMGWAKASFGCPITEDCNTGFHEGRITETHTEDVACLWDSHWTMQKWWEEDDASDRFKEHFSKRFSWFAKEHIFSPHRLRWREHDDDFNAFLEEDRELIYWYLFSRFFLEHDRDKSCRIAFCLWRRHKYHRRECGGSAVPLPSTILLLGPGLFALGIIRKRLKNC